MQITMKTKAASTSTAKVVFIALLAIDFVVEQIHGDVAPVSRETSRLADHEKPLTTNGGGGTKQGSGRRSLTISTLQSLFGRNDQDQDCVLDEVGLRTKVQGGGVVVMCPATTITLGSEIEISNARFELRCGNGNESSGRPSLFRNRNTPSPTLPCIISGGKKTRLFSGEPLLASFQDLTFRDGKDLFRGGAFKLSDGTTFFKRCKFVGNEANSGAALYIVGLTTEVSMKDSLVESNVAVIESVNDPDDDTGAAGIGVISGAFVTFIRSTLASNNATNGAGSALVVSSSIVVLKDSIVTRNVGAKGGALLIAESRVSLANTTFGNNIALNGKASDVLIAATASAFDGGTFVRCDMGSFVNFCNGVAKGIFIPPQQTNIPNTNCNVDAISNPTSSLCAAVAV